MKNWSVKANVPADKMESLLLKADAADMALFQAIPEQGPTYLCIFRRKWKNKNNYSGSQPGGSKTNSSGLVSFKQQNMLKARLRDAGAPYPDDENEASKHPFVENFGRISQLSWKRMDEALDWIGRWKSQQFADKGSTDTGEFETDRPDDFDWTAGMGI